jgi:FAD:protein FMN transferase
VRAGLAGLAVLLTTWSTAAAAPGFVSFEHSVMATRLTVTLPDRAGAEQTAAGVVAIFEDLEARLSEWRPGSQLARINANAGGEPVPVDPEVLALIAEGLRFGVLTDGAFDITWAALWGTWDFRAEDPVVPDRGVLESLSGLVDYRRVEVDPIAGTVRLPEPGMKLGLGGIAKGQALDRAGAWLKAQGWTVFTLSAGGQVLAGGQPGARPWQVGVRDPRGLADDWFAVVPAVDSSVSTSGDYERFFEVDGVRYHHILDPQTGWPATSGLRSVTVLSPDATTGDVLSTALFVLGLEHGLALVEGLPGVEALVVDDQGGVHATLGLADHVVLRHSPRP